MRVLDTDYESFASVYSCLDGPFGAVKNENAFILTREMFPSDKTASYWGLPKSYEQLLGRTLLSSMLGMFQKNHNADIFRWKAPSRSTPGITSRIWIGTR